MDEKHILKKYDNGINALYIPMKSDLVYIMFCHRVGMIHEEKKEIECAHFLEHMLAEFTSKKYPDALENRMIIEDLGGSFNAHVTENDTTYYITARKQHFPKLMDLIGNAYLNFHIDESIFEQERNAVTEELSSYKTEVWNDFDEKVVKFLFPNSGVASTNEDSIKNTQKLTAKDLYDFKDKYYSADNTVLTVSGGIPEKQMKCEAEKFLSKVKKSETPELKKTELTKLDGPSIVFVKTKEADIYSIKIIFRHSYEFNCKEVQVLEAISNVLTKGMSSRLMEILRGKEGLIYNIKIEVDNNPYFPEMGIFMINTKTDKKNVKKVIEVVIGELKKLKSRVISKKEYERLMEIQSTDVCITKTDKNPERFAEKYSESVLFQKPVETFTQMDKTCKSITREDIKKESKKLFNFDEFLVAYSGPTEIKKLKFKI